MSGPSQPKLQISTQEAPDPQTPDLQSPMSSPMSPPKQLQRRLMFDCGHSKFNVSDEIWEKWKITEEIGLSIDICHDKAPGVCEALVEDGNRIREIMAMKDVARKAAGETDPELEKAMMELVRQVEKKEREMLEGADGIPSASVD